MHARAVPWVFANIRIESWVELKVSFSTSQNKAPSGLVARAWTAQKEELGARSNLCGGKGRAAGIPPLLVILGLLRAILGNRTGNQGEGRASFPVVGIKAPPQSPMR